MRPELCTLLYSRYPDLYMRDGESSDCFSVLCDDGWFLIVDALSETLLALDPACRDLEVKKSAGVITYSFVDNVSGVSKAIRAAETFSSLVCEVTGNRGELYRSGRSFYELVSNGEAFRSGGTRVSLEDWPSLPSFYPLRFGRPFGSMPFVAERRGWSQDMAENVLREFNAYAFSHDCTIDVPAEGFDLVHAIIRSLVPPVPNHWLRGNVECLKINSINWRDQSGLTVGIDPVSLGAVAKAEFDMALLFKDILRQEELSIEHETRKITSRLKAVMLFAKNMSKRIDFGSGRIGPVDDQGELIGVVVN